MSVRIRNVLDLLSKVDHALEVADKKHTFESGLSIAKEIMALLSIDDVQTDLKSFPRLKANPSWTKNAPDYEDRKASFALAENNDHNIDFKLYWVTKPAKRIISNLVALTPNFEDEVFYSNKNVGIDFVLPDKPDRLIVVLSNNYKIRILEIHRHLSNTQKKIFEKWAQELDFSNKAQIHKVLWDSFDIQPLNKEFYLEISSFFNELVQHLEKEDILDKKHRPQFVNRLIGRIIFCWFLRKKEIISEDIGYFDTNGKPAADYYAQKLETLFFKVLNTPLEERGFGIEGKTPFLNGGLFEEKESDLAGRGELSFPVDYFDRFYSFLNRYNFTTDESTSDFQQVAIDPEMLGRIFENLLAEEMEETGEQARKAKGAFYTPREIVDYMCRESLRAYMSEKLGNDTRKDEVLQLLFDKREHELDPKSVLGKLSAYKSRIIEVLDEIKIIDPACGSGAFPIGMLQIMLSIYERGDARLDHYKTKLAIIKNNIFGVDIEPMAVEISRLRTWLSLVVDAVIKPSEKNKGIEELPNLDFKFICANSLIPLAQTEWLFDNKKMAEQMQAIRERYFKTNSLRIKDKMKRDFEDILKNNQNIFASPKQKQLLTYHPFDSDNVTKFFDSQFIFGVDKFDVVIANPPYVNIVSLPEETRMVYKKLFSITKNKVDLYAYFLERGLGVIKENGFLTYIVPQTWKATSSFSKFRELIFKRHKLWQIVDLDFGVFDAIVKPVIIFICNKHDTNYSIIVKGSDFALRNSINIKEVLASPSHELDTSSSEDFKKVFKKIEMGSSQLSSIIEFSRGIKTSNDNRFLTKEKKESKEYKKVFRGKNIKAYSINWGGEYVWYRPDLMREKVGCLPHTREFFEVPQKLITQRVNSSMQLLVAFDDQQRYFLDTTNVSNFKSWKKKDVGLKFLCGVLNSKTINFYYCNKYRMPTIGGYELHSIPIKEGNIQSRKKIETLVDKIIELTKFDRYQEDIVKQAKVEEYKNEIDEIVMDVYGLTKEEREIIYKS